MKQSHLIVPAWSSSLHTGLHSPAGKEVPPPSLRAGGDQLHITERPARETVTSEQSESRTHS